MKDCIRYVHTFMKKGYKPFSKTITHELETTMIYDKVIPIKHIFDVVEKVGNGWLNDSSNEIDALRIKVDVYYNNERISITSKTFRRDNKL